MLTSFGVPLSYSICNREVNILPVTYLFMYSSLRFLSSGEPVLQPLDFFVKLCSHLTWK